MCSTSRVWCITFKLHKDSILIELRMLHSMQPCNIAWDSNQWAKHRKEMAMYQTHGCSSCTKELWTTRHWNKSPALEEHATLMKIFVPLIPRSWYWPSICISCCTWAKKITWICEQIWWKVATTQKNEVCII